MPVRWPALGVCALALTAGACTAAEGAALAETKAGKVYTVNRKVSDFPNQEDMSTPEAAYATLNRLSASGDETFWQRLSVPRKEERMRNESEKGEVSAEERAKFLGAEILEVHLWDDRSAVVIARMPKDWDLRWLSWVDGKWLNDGNDGEPSLELARARIPRVRAFKQVQRLRDSRPPVTDPDNTCVRSSSS